MMVQNQITDFQIEVLLWFYSHTGMDHLDVATVSATSQMPTELVRATFMELAERDLVRAVDETTYVLTDSGRKAASTRGSRKKATATLSPTPRFINTPR